MRQQGYKPSRLLSAASVLFVAVAAVTLYAQAGGQSGVRAREEVAKDFRPIGIRRVEGRPLRLSDPENTILVIFNHGSTAEYLSDTCRQDIMPPVVAGLRGQKIDGKPIRVYAYCTPSKTGEYVSSLRSGEPKVIKRARDIETLLARARAMGVPARRIFLFGQSAGGWASLLVARRGRAEFNGLIAFAPAFSGQWATRSGGWWHLHNKLAGRIAEARRIEGLIFAFKGDAWNRVEDLAFLERIPGLSLIALDPDAIGGVLCKRSRPHFLAYRRCFKETQTTRILEFMKRRLRSAP